MRIIKLRYTGGKAVGKLYYNRTRYVFNKENNFITEVPEEIFWDKNFFMPAPVEKVKQEIKQEIVEEAQEPVREEKYDTKCSICGFKAKSPFGLKVHVKKHTRREK